MSSVTPTNNQVEHRDNAIISRSVFWLIFNVALCLVPFGAAMLVADNISFEHFHTLTVRGEIFLLGVGVCCVALGEWVWTSPKNPWGKVVLGMLVILLLTALFCYVESSKTAAKIMAESTSPKEIEEKLKTSSMNIVASLSLFGSIAVCSLGCMNFCWASTRK